MSEEGMRILKEAKCQSLSGRSTLSYKIGCKDDKEVFLCLTGNSGQGIFNKDWISLTQLDSVLAAEEKPITSGRLHEMFKGKSANSSGFVLAVLLSEKLLKISKGNLRHYERLDPTEFNAAIQALMALEPDATQPPPAKTAKKHKKEAP
ncbi:MAG: hypothetical protein KKA54_16125 [Proteobacteria bacterium]|nr:hypothetical protein [Pseudomonadota bacterium]MBU0967901.1 hypothetical protein [Pseudomonadota bacterium]